MVPNAFALDVLIDLFFFALESIPKNFESLFFASCTSVLRREGFIERNYSLFLPVLNSDKVLIAK